MTRLALPLFLLALLALPVLAGDAQDLYKEALEAQAQGDQALARATFEKVIAADPEHRAARRALGYERLDGHWYRGDDLMRKKGFVHYGGKWLTAQEFAQATRPQREAAAQKAGETRVLKLLAMVASEKPDLVHEARRRMADEPAKYKLAPLAKALRCKPTSLRIYAAEELARLDDPLAVPALLKRSIDDPDAEVRAKAVAALREIDEPSTVHPLGRALGSRYAEVRTRAAEAIGGLGDVLGVPHILVRWEKRSGDFPRAYFANIRQISYIQDFDVEVAQTSFIADPIVGTLQEGAVQAIKIHATEQIFTRLERAAFVGALRKLSGRDFGDDVKAWRKWWDENEADLLEKRRAQVTPGS